MKSPRKTNKWILLIVLSVGGGLMYQLPLLRYIFYEPLRQAMGVTDGQLGILASIYGTVSLPCYLPGGYVADKISPKKLITFSLIMTGTLGLWYSTFPPFGSYVIIFFAWGIVTVLTYWSAFIKAVGMLSEDGNTSKYYGLMDGIRGLTATIVSFTALYIFGQLAQSALGVKYVIILFSSLLILVGIISWFIVPNPNSKATKLNQNKITVKDVIKISKMKTSWLIAGIIFTAFGMLNASSYLVPYSETIFGASASLAVIIGIIRTHIMQLLGGPFGGILSNKLKSTPKALILGYIVALICSLVFLLTPIDKSLVMIIIVSIAVQGFMLCAMRGIYFSTINDAGYPEKITGSVIGFTSFIGFLTDGFFFGIAGNWIDRFAVNGYRMIFIYMAVLCICGVGLTLLFIKDLKQNKQNSKNMNNIY